jgi:hypothetical protein
MYHYGLIIRAYRKKAKMTQAQLADRWPKNERFGGGEGVNWKYVQDNALMNFESFIDAVRLWGLLMP